MRYQLPLCAASAVEVLDALDVLEVEVEVEVEVVAVWLPRAVVMASLAAVLRLELESVVERPPLEEPEEVVVAVEL